jgi:chromosome segregation ATPase
MSNTEDRLDRLEKIVEKLAETQLQQQQLFIAERGQTNERLSQLESTMGELQSAMVSLDAALEKLAERQFLLEQKQEVFEEKLNRIAHLLMESALNNQAAFARLDRVEKNIETLEKNLAAFGLQINRLTETLERYIAFRMNGSKGSH